MRPGPITIICVVFFVLSAINLLSVFLYFSIYPLERAIWILFTEISAIISVVGLWKMRKWGIYLYLGSFIVGLISISLFLPQGEAITDKLWAIFVSPLMYCAVVLPYWKKFTK